MSEEELRELSRQAAAIIPEQMYSYITPNDAFGFPFSEFVDRGYWKCENERTDWDVWFHESTEACLEIIAKVLLEECCYITPSPYALHCNNQEREIAQVKLADFGNDTTKALCVLALRALIALKP